MDVYLTTSEAIRATLGISEDSQEMTDDVFRDMELETEIELQLESWLMDAANTTVSTVMSTGPVRAQAALPLCAKYLGALIMATSLLTTTASKLSDGHDEFYRQDRDIEKLQKDLEAMLARYKAIVLEALGITISGSSYSSFFQIIGRSVPNYDPIRGV